MILIPQFKAMILTDEDKLMKIFTDNAQIWDANKQQMVKKFIGDNNCD